MLYIYCVFFVNLQLLGHLMLAAKTVAKQEGLVESGFRIGNWQFLTHPPHVLTNSSHPFISSIHFVHSCHPSIHFIHSSHPFISSIHSFHPFISSIQISSIQLIPSHQFSSHHAFISSIPLINLSYPIIPSIHFIHSFHPSIHLISSLPPKFTQHISPSSTCSY